MWEDDSEKIVLAIIRLRPGRSIGRADIHFCLAGRADSVGQGALESDGNGIPSAGDEGIELAGGNQLRMALVDVKAEAKAGEAGSEDTGIRINEYDGVAIAKRQRFLHSRMVEPGETKTVHAMHAGRRE